MRFAAPAQVRSWPITTDANALTVRQLRGIAKAVLALAVSLHCIKCFDTYSITSSARPSSVIGKVRPSALAVVMLMISSIRVASCTGRRAGLSH
jgi:hypothetical protein